MFLVTIEKFEVNPMLVNTNKFKPLKIHLHYVPRLNTWNMWTLRGQTNIDFKTSDDETTEERNLGYKKFKLVYQGHQLN